jgi:hypothetical protein
VDVTRAAAGDGRLTDDELGSAGRMRYGRIEARWPRRAPGEAESVQY